MIVKIEEKILDVAIVIFDLVATTGTPVRKVSGLIMSSRMSSL